MRYEVCAIPDGELPTGVDWAFAKVSDAGESYLFVKRSLFDRPEVLCRVLSAAWVAWAACEAAPNLLAAAM